MIEELWYIVRTPNEWRISNGLSGDRSISYDFPIDSNLHQAMRDVTYRRRKEIGYRKARILFDVTGAVE